MASGRTRFFLTQPPGTILTLKTDVIPPGSAATDAEVDVNGVKSHLSAAALANKTVPLPPLQAGDRLRVRFDIVFLKPGRVMITPSVTQPGPPVLKIARSPIDLQGLPKAVDRAMVTVKT